MGEAQSTATRRGEASRQGELSAREREREHGRIGASTGRWGRAGNRRGSVGVGWLGEWRWAEGGPERVAGPRGGPWGGGAGGGGGGGVGSRSKSAHVGGRDFSFYLYLYLFLHYLHICIYMRFSRCKINC
jgi:hypothetical protein